MILNADSVRAMDATSRRTETIKLGLNGGPDKSHSNIKGDSELPPAHEVALLLRGALQVLCDQLKVVHQNNAVLEGKRAHFRSSFTERASIAVLSEVPPFLTPVPSEQETLVPPAEIPFASQLASPLVSTSPRATTPTRAAEISPASSLREPPQVSGASISSRRNSVTTEMSDCSEVYEPLSQEEVDRLQYEFVYSQMPRSCRQGPPSPSAQKAPQDGSHGTCEARMSDNLHWPQASGFWQASSLPRDSTGEPRASARPRASTGYSASSHAKRLAEKKFLDPGLTSSAQVPPRRLTLFASKNGKAPSE